MGRLASEKYAATSQHKSNLRNIRGTFAAEGMTISKSTRSNLDRIASGQTSYQQVLIELRAKYEKRGYLCRRQLQKPKGDKYHESKTKSSRCRDYYGSHQ